MVFTALIWAALRFGPTRWSWPSRARPRSTTRESGRPAIAASHPQRPRGIEASARAVRLGGRSSQARELAPQSIPFALIVRCLVALVARRRTTRCPAGIVGHRASQEHGTPPSALVETEFREPFRDEPPGRARGARARADCGSGRRRAARAGGGVSPGPRATAASPACLACRPGQSGRGYRAVPVCPAGA
jgi:hypothetical protein